MTSPVSPSETIAKAMEGVTNKVTWSVEGYDDATGQVNVVGGGFFIAGVITNQPDQEATAAYIAACNPVAMREVLDELYALRETALKLETMQRRAEDAEALAERLKLEAQSHAMEARTANSTIAEIYQVVSGGNGEPGNWHGATPVRERLEAMQREMAEKDAEASWHPIATCPIREPVDLWCVYGGEEFAQYDGGASIGKLVPNRHKTEEYGFFGNQSNDGVPQGHARDLIPVAWRKAVPQCPSELIAEVLGVPRTIEDARALFGVGDD